MEERYISCSYDIVDFKTRFYFDGLCIAIVDDEWIEKMWPISSYAHAVNTIKELLAQVMEADGYTVARRVMHL